MDNTTNHTTINILEAALVYPAFGYVTVLTHLILGLWCVVANGFLISVLVRYESLHTRANAFVANIAASDICVGVVVIGTRPLNLLGESTQEFVAIACTVIISSSVLSQLLSIHALLLATGERYVKICHPFRYQTVTGWWIVFTLLCLSWVNSVVIAGSIVINTPWSYNGICPLAASLNLVKIIVIGPYVVALLLVTLYCNVRIFGTIVRHRREIQQSGQGDENVQRANMIGLVVLFTFLAYIPYLIHTFAGYGVNKTSVAYRMFEIINMMLLYCNNIINPLLFGWKDKNIRKYATMQLSAMKNCCHRIRKIVVRPADSEQ